MERDLEVMKHRNSTFNVKKNVQKLKQDEFKNFQALFIKFKNFQALFIKFKNFQALFIKFKVLNFGFQIQEHLRTFKFCTNPIYLFVRVYADLCTVKTINFW